MEKHANIGRDILASIVGGMVETVFSGSQLSVSGPVAGLTVIMLGAEAQ